MAKSAAKWLEDVKAANALKLGVATVAAKILSSGADGTPAEIGSVRARWAEAMKLCPAIGPIEDGADDFQVAAVRGRLAFALQKMERIANLVESEGDEAGVRVEALAGLADEADRLAALIAELEG
jgi:hypothetical protein